MSLINPKSVVTEERLREFYGSILPYLGGMPEMLANKFSKGDLYSTDEKMIGQWVDGKPLYQRTFSFTTQSSQGWTNINHNISNIDYIQVKECFVGGYTQGATTGTNLIASADATIVGVWSNTLTNKPAIVTIQYTKTTDSPISIGNDTDYSTEEKIIGTWIDGKPLYQRSYKFENFSISPSDTQKNFGDISSLSIDYGMVVEALIDDGGYLGTNWVDVFIRKSEGTFGAMSATKTISNKTIYITIQYTKAN